MARSPYQLNSYVGGANYGTLSGTIMSTDTTINVSGTGAGWGNLGQAGPFNLSLNYGFSGEEKINCPSGIYPWGNPIVTITGITRGYDGTVAQNQQNGYSVVHVFTATDLTEANQLVSDILYYAPTSSGQVVTSDGVGVIFTPGGGGSNIASLSGPGLTTSPGLLVQSGGLNITDDAADGINITTSGTININTTNGVDIVTQSGFSSFIAQEVVVSDYIEQTFIYISTGQLQVSVSGLSYYQFVYSGNPNFNVTPVTIGDLCVNTASLPNLWQAQQVSISGWIPVGGYPAQAQVIFQCNGQNFINYGTTSINPYTFTGIINLVNTTPPILLPTSGGVFVPNAYDISSEPGGTLIQTPVDQFDIQASIYITDLTATNIATLYVSNFAPIHSSFSYIPLDWSTATFTVISGTDLSWSLVGSYWQVTSSGGGIYMIYSYCLAGWD